MSNDFQVPPKPLPANDRSPLARMNSPDEPLADVHHNDLWFSDGSVVLRAEQTLFRVHMSQLSRRSLLFRDIFSLPQPPAAKNSSQMDISHFMPSHTDLIEGCPVIHLHDRARDLENLLIALYDGPTFGNNGRQDFSVVSGILRLSTKYLIDSLRAKALAHLSEAWPSTLKEWDTREEHARIFELETGKNRAFRYPSPIAVINLAREIDARSLLPAAFYDLSRYSYSQLFEPSTDDPLYDPSLSSMTHNSTGLLSPLDMQKLTLGKEAALQMVPTLIQSMTSPLQPHPHHPTSNTHRRNLSASKRSQAICTTASACRSDFLELAQLATQHYIFDRERGYADPLYVAEELGQLKSAETSEGEDCVACARSLEDWAAKERQKLWKMIPTWFRLGC